MSTVGAVAVSFRLAPGDLTPAGLGAAVAPHVAAAMLAETDVFRARFAERFGPVIRRLALAAFDTVWPSLTSPAVIARAAALVVEILIGVSQPWLLPYAVPLLTMLLGWPAVQADPVTVSYIHALQGLLHTPPEALSPAARYGLAHPAPAAPVLFRFPTREAADG